MTKRTLGLIVVSTLLVIGGWFIFTNRQELKDRYVVYATDISAEAADLAESLELTDQAKFLYEASQTALQNAAEFRSSCQGLEKQNIVLGCYTKQRIYVYDIEEKQLEGVREVTAAHELLHAVYERLSQKEKTEINQLLKQQALQIKDGGVKETLDLYKGVSQADFFNEMYAIFGTEVDSLIPKLEQHYSMYFEDRKKIVAFAKNYQQTFRDLEEQRADYDSQLVELKIRIDQLQSTVSSQQVELDERRAQLDELRANDQTTQYNSRIGSFNSLVNQYNSNVRELRSAVSNYNEIVQKRNAIVTTENNLAQELDASADLR